MFRTSFVPCTTYLERIAPLTESPDIPALALLGQASGP